MTLPVRNEESEARARAVTALAAGSHIHIIGICGVGTCAAATLLKSRGFRVTGSDKAFYPPMGERIRRTADHIYEGFSPDNLTERPDLVVIGNAVWRNNEEANTAIASGIPYASMPELFEGMLIGPREETGTSVVVAGTHGKSTTSAAVTVMLDRAGLVPGYFVGGKLQDLPDNIRTPGRELPPERRVVVLEGDEYDSAYFAKWPKFHSYRPDIVIMTSCEFDHGDIYQSVDEIALEFERLIERVPAEGHILVADDAPRLAQVVESARSKGWLKASLWFYGEREDSPFRLVRRQVNGPTQELELLLNGERCTLTSHLTGPQNGANFLAAAGVGKLLGLSCEQIGHGLGGFHGVARRQDIVDEINGITLIDDFAHHPTAVRLTVQGLRETYAERRLIVAYEPRSNTSSRAFFQQDYVESFSLADVAVIAQPKEKERYGGTAAAVESLDVEQLVSDLAARNVRAHAIRSLEAVEQFLVDEAQPGDVLVLMSNGDFGGLMPRLVARLRDREAAGAGDKR